MEIIDRDLSSLLTRCQSGDKQARDQLFDLLYPELKRVANIKVGKSPRKLTLQATEIINELYIRLSGVKTFPGKSRLYFFAAAAAAIEQIIIEYYRSKSRLKRGGDVQHIELNEQLIDDANEINEELLQLGQLLNQLKGVDLQCSQIAQLKLMAGMKNADIAESLDISVRSVGRKWAFAKRYLNFHL